MRKIQSEKEKLINYKLDFFLLASTDLKQFCQFVIKVSIVYSHCIWVKASVAHTLRALL